MRIVERIASIEHRLQQAERRERRWRLTSVAITIGVTLLVVSGQAPRARVVEAETFVVRDANGHARAQLGINDSEPGLTLFDTDGRLRAAIAVEPAGPILSFFNGDGNPRAVVGERGDTAFVILRDAEGAPRAAMAIQADGSPSLYLLDDKMTPLWKRP